MIIHYYTLKWDALWDAQSYEIERKNLYRGPNEGSCNVMSVASFFIGEWRNDLHMRAGHWVACLFWDLNRLTDVETNRQTDQFSDRCKIRRHSTMRIAFVITYREATFVTGIVTHYFGLTLSCADYHNHCAYHFQSLV